MQNVYHFIKLLKNDQLTLKGENNEKRQSHPRRPKRQEKRIYNQKLNRILNGGSFRRYQL